MLWVALLTLASALTTWALACATPFAALAAIAAVRLPMREGATLLTLSWVVSQMIGFALLHYPRDPLTIAWGLAMLSAALFAFAGARWGARIVARFRTATAFGTGFLSYKATLLAWSFVLGGVHTAASPYWTARQFGQEAVILMALVALYHVLVAVGVPAARRVIV